MVVASEQHLHQTIVQFDKTIVLPRILTTGSIHAYCPLVVILFEVLRIEHIHTETVSNRQGQCLDETQEWLHENFLSCNDTKPESIIIDNCY